MIHFSLAGAIDDLRQRTASFVRDVVIPYEDDPRQAVENTISPMGGTRAMAVLGP